MGTEGSTDVIVGGKRSGYTLFGNVSDKIKSVKWMDNGEKLDFVQKNGMFCVDMKGYHYGTSLIVRVAKAEIEK